MFFAIVSRSTTQQFFLFFFVCLTFIEHPTNTFILTPITCLYPEYRSSFLFWRLRVALRTCSYQLYELYALAMKFSIVTVVSLSFCWATCKSNFLLNYANCSEVCFHQSKFNLTIRVCSKLINNNHKRKYCNIYGVTKYCLFCLE